MGILERFRKMKEEKRKNKIHLEKLKMRGFQQIDKNKMAKKEDILGFWCHNCNKNISEIEVKNHLKMKHKVFLAKFGEEIRFANIKEPTKSVENTDISNIKLIALKRKKVKKEKVTPIKYFLEMHQNNP